MLNEAAAVSNWKNNNKKAAAGYIRVRKQFEADGIPLFDKGFDLPVKYNDIEYSIESEGK